MTNTDFWTSISNVIADGFTSEGLSILDKYAEQFISGRIVYKRFSPQEQHGCSAGGTTHVVASLLSAASIGSDCLTAPVGSFKREQQLAAIQEKSLFWIATSASIPQSLGAVGAAHLLQR